MFLREIIKSIHKKILEKASSERKIEYWRKQGMKIGKNCRLETMSFSTEPYLIEIGDHVAIAMGTDFVTHDGGIWCFRHEIVNGDIFGKIKIGDNVMIGVNCTILPNTVVGNNCIIGAGSVVRGKFPDNSVIFGNPAKVVLSMCAQRLLYCQSQGFLKTNNLTITEKTKAIKKHFKIE
jgi:acetyltransferase-like isoleucine patch superfamily enzyme